jgi:hypothetical protein
MQVVASRSAAPIRGAPAARRSAVARASSRPLWLPGEVVQPCRDNKGAPDCKHAALRDKAAFRPVHRSAMTVWSETGSLHGGMRSVRLRRRAWARPSRP